MVAESVHLKTFFLKKICLPKSFILTKSAAETDHKNILTAEIAHFKKIRHVAETVHFWWPKLFIWKNFQEKNQKILDCRNRSYCKLQRAYKKRACAQLSISKLDLEPASAHWTKIRNRRVFWLESFTETPQKIFVSNDCEVAESWGMNFPALIWFPGRQLNSWSDP